MWKCRLQVSLDAEDIRDEKVKVLRSMKQVTRLAGRRVLSAVHSCQIGGWPDSDSLLAHCSVKANVRRQHGKKQKDHMVRLYAV